jgi:opine dehydrogenase
VLLGCTETLVYATRLRRPGQVDIKAIKKAVSVAALPAADGEWVFQAFRTLYPQAVRCGSVLETSFANTNPIMHPPIVLANARIIDEGIAPFDFYGTGVTTGVASVIDAVDAERMAVAAALGVPTKSHHEWVKFAYGLNGDDTAALCVELSAKVYKGIESPAMLRSRYLTEDVPLGLVPWALLAQVAGVPTPVMDSIITLASTMCREDFRSTGRTLARMGLDGMGVAQILAVAGGEQRRAMAGSA